MVKLIGAVLIVFATAYIGTRISARKKLRVEQLFLIEKILTEFSEEIKYSAEPYESLKEKYLSRESYEKLDGMNEDSLAISLEEKAEIREFSEQSGRCGRDMQVMLCESFAERIGRRARDAEKTIASEVKVINAVGFFSGVILSLLIL